MAANEFYLPKDGKITSEFLRRCIERKIVLNNRLDKLENYYLGNQPIMEKFVTDSTMPDNKVLTNYCKVIADFFATSLTGKPIEYDAENPKDINLIQNILDNNDIEVVDAELSSNINVFGVAYEQEYINEEGQLRFISVDPRNVVLIHDRTPEMNVVAAIKLYKFCEEDTTYEVELYHDGKVITYEYETGNRKFKQKDKKNYTFNQIPFQEITANKYKQSTFEQIMTIQDAYNKLVSLEIDDYEGFVDSFLGIYNAGGTTDEDIANMKKNRVLLLDGESRAEWIVKNANPQVIEDIKESLEKNIHQISLLPDFSDKNFVGNTSGVAIKYKMIGANSVLAKQERSFSNCISNRLKLICDNINATTGKNVKFEEITYSFKRLEIDEDETITDMIEKLDGKIPLASLAKNLSFTTPEDIEKIKKVDDKLGENPMFDNNNQNPFFNNKKEKKTESKIDKPVKE